MPSPTRSYSISAYDEGSRSVRVLASTASPVVGAEVAEDGTTSSRLESLETWNLERFVKNPVVLWQHDASCSAIGLADEVQVTDRGLEMRINFAPSRAEPMADDVIQKIKDGLIRGVSVGFSFGTRTDEVRDGQPVAVFRDNILNEVSLVTIPADENALVDAPPLAPVLTDEEARRQKLSEAARHLASARTKRSDESITPRFASGSKVKATVNHMPGMKGMTGEVSIVRTDPPYYGVTFDGTKTVHKWLAEDELVPADTSARMDSGDVRRFDTTNRLGKAQRTQLGGIRVPARLARIGVLRYRLADGSYRRELRLPEEVFHPDSLASLKSATVTDIAHHKDFIDTNSWKDAALGHVEDIRIDSDKYVTGELVINDESTIARIDSGELADISCGYSCKLDATPGTWNGEEYDVVQRHIRHNHVAVLPPGRGRSGADVGIRLDSTDAESVEPPIPEDTHMTIKIIHFDGKDYEYGSELHVSAINAIHEKQLAAVKAEAAVSAAAVQKRLDETEARFDASEKAAKKAAADKEAEEAKEVSARGLRFKRRLSLVRAAMRAFGEEEDDETSGTSKMDALDDLSDRDLMVKVVKHLDADFDATGKSDDYVTATFDIVVKSLKRADGVDAVVREVERIKRADASDGNDPESAAKLAMQKRLNEAGRKPFGIQA